MSNNHSETWPVTRAEVLPSDRPLLGRTALVTGGAKGIGRSCCLRLAQAGANVAINYLTSGQQAHETAELVRRAGVQTLLVRADVSSSEQVSAMVNEVVNTLGPVELLVNNAGVFHFVPHEATSLAIWQKTLDVNLTGTYLVTWAVNPIMIERGFGRIVNIASIAGLRPRPMSIAYSASKAGLIGLTKSLAEALASHNIPVGKRNELRSAVVAVRQRATETSSVGERNELRLAVVAIRQRATEASSVGERNELRLAV